MPEVIAYTDGACKGNPGPGGWGVVLTVDGVTTEYHGGEQLTTNNRMELLGAITAIEAIPAGSEVKLTTDSQYVIKGFKEWLPGWKKKGWRTASKEPVKNVDLWKRLDAAIAGHNVEWLWVRGHTGDPGNERADELANMGCAEFQKA